MTMEEVLFWDRYPSLLPIYLSLRDELIHRHPETIVKVAKTQISFYEHHLYSMVSPPIRRRKGWPDIFMLISFGLPYRIESGRIISCTEAYPGRWTHHVLVETPEQLDETLFSWIDEAHAFSKNKR